MSCVFWRRSRSDVRPGTGRRSLWLVLLLTALLVAASASAGSLAVPSSLPSSWTRLLVEARESPTPGTQVAFLSAAFLGVPYRAQTLSGGPGQPEQLVVNLAAVDCFTLLDYVEALRRSETPEQFPGQLRAVRYRGGEVSWQTRRHFFTDWVSPATAAVADVTRQVGGEATRELEKQLNQRGDGQLWLPGLAVEPRTISYLPVSALDSTRLAALQTGDYLGFVSLKPGLDVTHTGIFIRTSQGLFLRHASSVSTTPRVVDSPFHDFLARQQGLVVLRPR